MMLIICSVYHGVLITKRDITSLFFSAHVCCGQTAVWIKMPLGRMVGLDPGNIVLHGDPAPPKGDTALQCLAHSIVVKRSPSQLLLSACFMQLSLSLVAFSKLLRNEYATLVGYNPGNEASLAYLVQFSSRI